MGFVSLIIKVPIHCENLGKDKVHVKMKILIICNKLVSNNIVNIKLRFRVRRLIHTCFHFTTGHPRGSGR